MVFDNDTMGLLKDLAYCKDREKCFEFIDVIISKKIPLLEKLYEILRMYREHIKLSDDYEKWYIRVYLGSLTLYLNVPDKDDVVGIGVRFMPPLWIRKDPATKEQNDDLYEFLRLFTSVCSRASYDKVDFEKLEQEWILMVLQHTLFELKYFCN